MKRILSLTMITAIALTVIVSCKDDFNEEDIALLRAELRSKADADRRALDSAEVNFAVEQEVASYITALNEAGDLLAVTFLARENGNPVEGVSVTLTTGTSAQETDGRAKAILQATTDATGNVTFERVVIGSGTVSFSKQGYVGTTAQVNFGSPAGPTPISTYNNNVQTTRWVPPVKRYESGVIPMYSTDDANENTAVIEGIATIETDVTNLTPEYPAGTIIRANLTSLGATNLPGFISNFAFADSEEIGVAVVGANGSFSMRVPATATASDINLIIPNIDGTRRTAVNGYDNGTGTAVALPNGPEYRDVPTRWGPQASQSLNVNIPTVVGAKVVFPDPPAAGSGLQFSTTPIGRELPLATISSTQVVEFSTVLHARIAHRGNYGNSLASPQVSISGGGGSGATATAAMRTYLSAVTVTNVGSGYGASVGVIIRGTFADGSTINLSTANILTVGGSLPATINLATLNGNNGGFGIDDAVISLAGHEDLVSVDLFVPPSGVQNASVNPTFVTELESISITNGGTGYSTPPTITLTGGPAGSTPAQAQIVQLDVFWLIQPDNSASQNYQVRPSTFVVSYPPNNYSSSILNDQFVDMVNSGGTAEAIDQVLTNVLTVQNGHVVPLDPGRIARSNSAWGTAPVVIVSPLNPVKAGASFAQASISETTGEITADPTINSVGSGYASQPLPSIEPAITGAPGAGASMVLSYGFNTISKAWSWNGGISAFTSRGSGYLRNLNQRAQQGQAGLNSVVTVQAGKTYQVNLQFGTGSALVPIN